MQDTLHFALRRATAQRHTRIEKLLRLDAPFTLTHYRAVLRGFDVFWRGWEPAVLAALPAGEHAWWAARSRRRLLRGDLEALGVAPSATPVRTLPLAGPDEAFGSLYVLEGSALGGQVVARRLQEQHGLDAGRGSAYFLGWGERTGALWRDFLARLEAHDAAGGDRARACDAAVRTFDALHDTCARELDVR